jgi:CDP-4-dehydro-6-deoxyglucose reductase
MPTLTVVPNDVSIDVKADETILDALYRHGYAYRIGCKRGGCAICKVDLLEGEVTYNRPVAEKVLTDEEKAEGICLSCRAVPTTDIVISLREDSLRTVNPLLAMINARKNTG